MRHDYILALVGLIGTAHAAPTFPLAGSYITFDLISLINNSDLCRFL